MRPIFSSREFVLGDNLDFPADILPIGAHHSNSDSKDFVLFCSESLYKQLSGSISTEPTGYFIFCYLLHGRFHYSKFYNSDYTIVDAINRKVTQVGNILLLLNPFSGTKRAQQIFTEIVEPLFTLARVSFELVKTTHENHAFELMQSLDYNKYSVVCAISGDGLFHEVVNGLLSRKDFPSSNITLATIGAGTSNAIAHNLQLYTPEECVFAILSRNTTLMDAFSIIQGNSVFYSHLHSFFYLI
jgi:hypothetical protein